MSAQLANISMGAAILLTGVAAVLMIVGIISASRLRSGRMAWVTVAFAVLTVQGIRAALEAYATRADPVFPTATLLSLGVVIALYASVLAR